MQILPIQIDLIIFKYIFDSNYDMVLTQLKNSYGKELVLKTVPFDESCNRVGHDTLFIRRSEYGSYRVWIYRECPTWYNNRYSIAADAAIHYFMADWKAINLYNKSRYAN
jgi:hypothetical protein